MKSSIIQLTVTFPEKVFLAYALREMEYRGLSDGILDLTRRALAGQALEHLSFQHLPLETINTYEGASLVSMRIEKEELMMFKKLTGRLHLATYIKRLLKRVLSYEVTKEGKVVTLDPSLALSSKVEHGGEDAGASSEAVSVEIPPSAEKEEEHV